VSVRIRYGDQVATFAGCWTADDPALVQRLERATPYDQHSPSIPRFDLFAARAVVASLGPGAVIEWISPDRPMPPDTVY